jgi:uncharacterized membrane protein
MKFNWRSIFHIGFRTGILFKGIDGILEIAGGLILACVSRRSIISFVYELFAGELSEDPNDFLANHILKLARHLSISAQIFAAFYLLAHGAIKLGLASAIWYNKLWSYPVAGVVLSGLVAYQIVRFSSTHSIILLVLTIIDILIIAMLKPEYDRLVGRLR